VEPSNVNLIDDMGRTLEAAGKNPRPVIRVTTKEDLNELLGVEAIPLPAKPRAKPLALVSEDDSAPIMKLCDIALEDAWSRGADRMSVRASGDSCSVYHAIGEHETERMQIPLQALSNIVQRYKVISGAKLMGREPQESELVVGDVTLRLVFEPGDGDTQQVTIHLPDAERTDDAPPPAAEALTAEFG
jgi:type II secretory ATPase GspE/PulE/Tfp pilus assembly ATPase PilB-like protein